MQKNNSRPLFAVVFLHAYNQHGQASLLSCLLVMNALVRLTSSLPNNVKKKYIDHFLTMRKTYKNVINDYLPQWSSRDFLLAVIPWDWKCLPLGKTPLPNQTPQNATNHHVSIHQHQPLTPLEIHVIKLAQENVENKVRDLAEPWPNSFLIQRVCHRLCRFHA